jgi:hypothetical protein
MHTHEWRSASVGPIKVESKPSMSSRRVQAAFTVRRYGAASRPIANASSAVELPPPGAQRRREFLVVDVDVVRAGMQNDI